jgi:Zn-dependent alcohol dehydrogenase
MLVARAGVGPGLGRLDLASLVSKTRPLAEVNEGIAEMREGKLTRVVLTF